MNAIPKTSRPRAFTLIELLIVIVIIALLITIMIPTLNHARERARATACASNMRQIGVGVGNYLTDYAGWMPPAIDEIHNFAEPNALPNILTYTVSGLPGAGNRKVFYCPSVVGNWDDNPIWDHTPTEKSDTTYMPNGAAMARPVAHIPQNVIIIHEQSLHSSTVWQRPKNGYTSNNIILWNATYFDPDFYIWHFYSTDEHYCNTHAAGGNLVYIDGHVEYRKYKTLHTRDYGLTPDEPWTPTNGNTPHKWGGL